MKRFSKVLALGKVTISRLTDGEMFEAKGGMFSYLLGCESIDSYKCETLPACGTDENP